VQHGTEDHAGPHGACKEGSRIRLLAQVVCCAIRGGWRVRIGMRSKVDTGGSGVAGCGG
jgi:hypothetical protein